MSLIPKSIYLFTETKDVINEDPRSAAERYDDALREGYINAHLLKVLIIGSAGVGKTHVLRLLLGKEPPQARSSTPVLERPVQVIQASSMKCGTFAGVSDEQLYELLASNVNRHATNTTSSYHHSDCLPQGTEYNTQEHNCVEHTSEYHNSEDKDQPPKNHFNTESFHLSDVTEKLIPHIAKCKDAPLISTDWIYFIDSGGQPQFHQLLPAFMHNTNLNIFVFRLRDKLSDPIPVPTYFENDACVSSFTSSMSNTEILQCCAQATQTTGQEEEPKLLIVGTHRDEEHMCDETKHDKDKLLLELLTPSMKSHLLYRSKDGDKLIFPINSKTPNEDDYSVVSEIVKSVLSSRANVIPTQIPLRWLVFHQELRNSDLLTIDQCIQIASRVHMSQQNVIEALKFFANLNVILYYQSVLPNIVFINPQVLLNLVTDIVNKTSKPGACDYTYIRACNEGIISEKLLERLKQQSPFFYKAGLFEPKDLIMLLLHLKVISKHGDGEYFMPSLLKGLMVHDIDKVVLNPCVIVAPGALHYKNSTWFKCGEFSTFVTTLLSSEQWKLAYEGHKPLCVYSNCITFVYRSCNVTLVDAVSFIEVHVYSDKSDICKTLCPEIKQSLLASLKGGTEWAFICPCKVVSQRHLAMQTTGAMWSCSGNNARIFSLSEIGPCAEAWLSGSMTTGDTMTTGELKITTQISGLNICTRPV